MDIHHAVQSKNPQALAAAFKVSILFFFSIVLK